MKAERMDVFKILKDHEQEIKERFDVKRIGVFGSFARGDQRETSDVDILVEFEKPTFDNFMDLAFFLEDLFQRKVDLVTPNSLSPYIGPYIRQGVVWAD